MQAGPSVSRRWQTVDSGPGEVITAYVYAAVDQDGRALIQEMWEWILCADVAQPGDTEEQADVRFHDNIDSTYGTTPEAVCRSFTLDDVVTNHRSLSTS